MNDRRRTGQARMRPGTDRAGVIAIALAVVPFGCTPSPLAEPWIPPRALEASTPTWRPPVLTEGRSAQEEPPRPQAPTGEITLRRTVALALLHSPQLAAHAYQVRAAEARVLQADLFPNPRVAFGVENFGGPDGGDLFERRTLRLSQVIELGGKREKRVALARADERLAAWDYEEKRLQVMTVAAGRFVAVVAAQQRVELATRTLDLARQVHEIVSERVGGGVVPTAERDKAAVRVSVETIVLEEARHALTAARHALAATWGGGEPQFAAAAGDFDDDLVVPDGGALLPLARGHPRLARWEDEINRRRRAVAVARARGVPDVTAGGGVRFFPDSDDTAGVVEFALPLPLIDRNQGRVLKARYELARAGSLARAARASMQADLAAARADLGAAAFSVRTLRDQARPAAIAAFEASRTSFAAGKSDYLVVLDAERTLVDVERRLIDARERYHRSVVRIEGLTATPLQR